MSLLSHETYLGQQKEAVFSDSAARDRAARSVVGGDWFKVLTSDGKPVLRHYKVGPWECPYHHARMCYEMIRRCQDKHQVTA